MVLSATERKQQRMLIIWLSPEIHSPLYFFLSLPDTYTSCSSPPPPPAFTATSSHLLRLLTARFPNEAPWEWSLAPSLKIDLFAFCCCWGAAGTDCLLRAPYGLAAPAFVQHTLAHTHIMKNAQASRQSRTLWRRFFFKLVCTPAQLSMRGFRKEEHMRAHTDTHKHTLYIHTFK